VTVAHTAPWLYEGQFPQAYLPLRGFATRDRYGPSILDQAGRCMRSWGLRYLCGFDSQEPEWSDIADHAWDGASRTWRGIIAATGAYQPVPSRKRSTALGTESHRIAGAFYEGLPSVPGYKTWAEAWASFPGQVAQAWLDVMPRPDECDQVFSELPVALYPDPEGEELPGGLVIEGTSDLLLKLRPEVGSKYFDAKTQHALRESDNYLVGDWKTTGDFDYQKRAYTEFRKKKRGRQGEYELVVPPLYTDKQGVIYPLASMRRLDLDALPGRWAYSITDVRKRREARATDFVQTREHAEAAVAGYFREAGVLKGHYRAFTAIKAGGSATSDVALADRLAYAQALPADTTKCDDFGGCPHSWERGGACMARRDLGSRLQGAAKAQAPSLEAALEASLAAGTCAATPTRVYTQDNQIMPASALARSKSMSPWKQAAERFKAAQAAKAAAPVPAAVLPEARASVVLDGETVPIGPAAEPALELEPVQPAAAEAPKRTRGRPPGAKNKPKAVAADADIQVGTAEAQISHPAEQAGADDPLGVKDKIEALRREAASEAFHAFDGGGAAAAARAEALYAEALKTASSLVDPGVGVDAAALETASEQAGAHAAAGLQHAPDPRAVDNVPVSLAFESGGVTITVNDLRLTAVANVVHALRRAVRA
jgi:hypothetical protein